MTPQEICKLFWYGTHYFRPPTPPPAEWEQDFAHLKRIGLRIIQARVFWRSYERKQGQYQWDELDRLMDQAHRHGLSVVHQIHLENAPQCVFDQFDGYRIDIRGHRIWPIAISACYQGGWIPCFDNPRVMSSGIEFVRRLVERYAKHPAMEFWHAWNEPRSRPMHECTCRHSVASYQQWLREKFGDIEKLNDAYGKSWADFESVDAARDTSDFAEMYLWRQWATTRVRDRVQRVVDEVRQGDRAHAVISHVGMNNMQQDPLNDISDDNLMHDVADLYGSSFEMRYTPEPIVHSLPFLVCDWMRHIGRGKYTIYELYPSGGRYEPEVPSHQFQQWLWMPRACAATSEFLWQFKKERVGGETNDAGLIEIDNNDNPTSLEAQKVFADFDQLSDRLAGFEVPRAKIAMVFDLKTDLISRIEWTVARDADYLGGYRLRWTLADAHLYKANFQGAYHLFWLNNVPIDVVSSQRLAEVVDQYEALYLPCMSIVDPQQAELLSRFVERGGRLLVDGAFATRQENSWVSRFRPSLTELGYREAQTTVHPPLRETLSFAGLELPVAVRTTSFELKDSGQDASILARWADGTPAAIEKPLGKGKVLALGFWPGISYLAAGNSAAWRKMVDHFVAWAGLASPMGGGASANITLRELRNAGGDKLTFALRRWGTDSATPDDVWQNWNAGGELLLNASHVKIAFAPRPPVSGTESAG